MGARFSQLLLFCITGGAMVVFFKWKNENVVNIQEIDQQHQKLVSMLNDLHMALMLGEGRNATFRILSQLVSYTKTHFATEERLMQAHFYSDLDGAYC